MIFVNSGKEQDQIFVARQPVFDRDKNVFAYELLFRDGFRNYTSPPDSESASIKVISNSLIIGLQELTAGKRAFIQFSDQLLLSRVPRMFPRELLGVEIPDEFTPDLQITDTLIKLKSAGYLLIINDFITQPGYGALLPLTDIIRIDFHSSNSRQRFAVIDQLSSLKIKLLADKIETQGHFDEASEMGYHYFQGFFFQKPELVSRREIPGFKVNYLEILKLTSESDFPFNEVETILKRDVSLTYKLLRFINSAAYGFRVEIRSIRHAMLLLGKREIRKWLTLIALSGVGGGKPRELLQNCLIRARFCELIGRDLNMGERSVELFLVGMLSMADAFLDKSLPEIMADLPLDDCIKSPLSGKPGLFRNILDLVIAYERADWTDAERLMKEINLEENKVVSNYVESVHWVKEF